MQLVGKHKRANRDLDGNVRKTFPVGSILLALVIAVIAFATRYWYNFQFSHVSAYGSADASEYLRIAGDFLRLHTLPTTVIPDGWSVITGAASPETTARLQQQLSILTGLKIGGPIFPLFLAASYAFSFTPFSMLTWQPPIFANSVVSALTCVFVALTASRVYGRSAGYIAGLLSALYPAFIINSGRLYSETFAAFLLMMTTYVTVRGFTEDMDGLNFTKWSVVNGILLACLQFTRSVMVILTLVALPITLLQQGWKKGIAGCLALSFGFALIALPWLGLQKVVFGQASLVVDRVGHYNFFIGNNVDTQGWLSVPYPDGRGIEEKSLPQLAKEAYTRSPSRWWSLMLDKPLRLFKFPWNDFRAPIDNFAFGGQVWYHQLLLMLALIGATVGFVLRDRPSADDLGYERVKNATVNPIAAKTYLLFVFLVHAVYLFFITVPRYNLTAMPILCIFGAAGVMVLFSLFRNSRGLTTGVAIATSVLLLFAICNLPLVNLAVTIFGTHKATAGLVIQHVMSGLSWVLVVSTLWMAISSFSQVEFNRKSPGKFIARAAVILAFVGLLPLFAFPANANGRWYEWHSDLSRPGQTALQFIKVPTTELKKLTGRQAYLLIDSDSAAQIATLKLDVNGKIIDQPILPALAYIDDFGRFQPVTAGYMREIEWVFSCLTQPSGRKNADIRQWFLVPIPNSAIPENGELTIKLTQQGNDVSRVYGAYATSRRHINIPSPTLYSWEKAFFGVESDQELSDTRYNVKLTNLASMPSNGDLSTAAGVQSGRYNIHLFAGPPIKYNRTLYTVEETPSASPQVMRVSSKPLRLANLTDSHPRESVDVKLPPFGELDLWAVRITGQVRRNAGSARLNMEATVFGEDRKKDYISPWASAPSYANQWKRFDMTLPLQPGALKESPTVLSLMISSKEPQSELAGLHVQGITEFRDTKLEIVRIPENPLHSGCLIF